MNPFALNEPGVSRVGLGCAAISRESTPDALAEETVLAAWDRGIRLFDTAPMYGNGLSELRLGRILEGIPRDNYVLSTKVGRLVDDITADGHGRSHHFDFSADGIKRSVEASFTRLGIDRADILYIHDPEGSWETVFHEALPVLHDLRHQGIVRAIGVGATRASTQVPYAQEADLDIFLMAGQYSLLDRAAINELFPLCEERGIAVLVAQMLHGGLIEGDPNPQIQYQPVDDATRQRVERIAGICHQFDVPMAVAAIQFPLFHPAVNGVVTGPLGREQVEQNLGWLETAIPEDLWAELKKATLLEPGVPVPGAEMETER